MFSNRIVQLANLFPSGLYPIDVGTDHAYLLIELIKSNKISEGIGVENKLGPLNNALINVKKYNLIDKLKIIHADGLSFDFDNKYNIVIFAGLGALNVIEIISKDITKLKNIKFILTDIHKNEDKLITYLNNLKYKIIKEISFIDKRINYHLALYEKEK